MKLVVSIFLFIFLRLQLSAQTVPDDRIKETASSFVIGYLGCQSHTVSGLRRYGDAGNPGLIVVDLSPEGWLLMTDDPAAIPVLGFSLTGYFTFPDEDINDIRYAFLSAYNRELKNKVNPEVDFRDHRWEPGYYLKKSSNGVFSVTVSPLIKVEWDQGIGWNRFCPEDIDGPGGRVYAGCVAVSMAQAMSVYKSPARGTGSKSYYHPDYGTISADFSITNYDWSAMSPDESDDQNARLLYHCAVSTAMDFGPDGSGTRSTAPAINAMKQYFGYSKRIVWTERLSDTDAWKALLDKNLLAGRPIIYSGSPPTGTIGHAFNIDGVHNSSYYHINWGWNGSNNGYYTINSLKPGSRDFTQGQAAVFNIQPFYYPTDVALSDTLVLLSLPAGKAVGKYSVVDEATDNSYEVSLECDSTLNGTEWVPDYYLDGDTLRAARQFERADGPIDTITFSVNDSHGNSIRAQRLLLLTASLSAEDGETVDTFKVYPVPVSDYLIITLPPSAERITIRNLRGEEVADLLTPDDRVTLQAAGFPPGIYIVTATTTGGKQYSRTIVKN
ncbi:MAG: C10 family peptidase [Actinomycetota bacterium]